MAELKIGSWHFKTKSEAMKWFGFILNDSKVGSSCSGEKMADMIHLIKRHPDADRKIGCGIDRFEIRENPVFKNQKTFYLIRTDGTETDFSFRICVTGNRSTSWANFCNAARNSVSSQIIVFKTAAFLGVDQAVCQITGEEVNWNTCHIDHVIPFKDIVKKFVAENSIDIQIEHTTGSEDGSVIRVFSDNDMDTQWKLFHKKHAVLRVTTVKANLARPRA